jgi:hypothetical protein
MPTIYTFGDPELLREILLALATIFNLVQWSDPGSSLGLGGNFLAVALIGLVAVGIAGITSQQVRVDYLFVALILFGIMFSAKTDVNVEDIQTGDSSVVADIPIGIAYVAAAASSAARELTDTTSVALQRPGSTTSVITQGGFMDPLKVLLAIRNMSLADLDENANKSLLEYYKICVGRTMVLNPGQFDQDIFRTTEDPIAYLFDVGNIANFNTTYYSAANPGGVAQSCWATAPLIEADINNLATGLDDGIEGFLTRVLGAENYNTSYDLTDIEDAVTTITRGAVTGQEFMSRLLLRNFHNTGEAWRLAEYGSNQAQYVATLTDAFETQRVNIATEGSIFLQFMLPLMSFFQFLFFAIAPFMALVMVASPFSAAKVLGMYLLFGVWSYMWMPVAAIINHYMEISLQNSIEFSGTGALNTGYTALLGFDDFYNIAATKLAIGGNALASTPIIVGAILTGTVFGIANLAGKFSQAGNANKTNTSIASPSLAQNQPLVNVGGRGSFAYGTVFGAGVPGTGASSDQQNMGYGQVGYREAAGVAFRDSSAMRSSAERSLGSSIKEGSQSISELTQSVGASQALSQNFAASNTQAFKQALRSVISAEEASGLSAGQMSSLASHLGLPLGFAGVREGSEDNLVSQKRFGEIEQAAKERQGEIAASYATNMSATSGITEEEGSRLRDVASSLQTASQEYDQKMEASSVAERAGNALMEQSRSHMVYATDVAAVAIRNDGDAAVGNYMNWLTGEFGSNFAADVQAGSRQKFFENGAPIGVDGLNDFEMDSQDKLAGAIDYLSDLAATGKNPRAALALAKSTNFLAGFGTPGAVERNAGAFESLAGADARVASGEGLADEVSGAVTAAQVNGEADGIRSEAANRQSSLPGQAPNISADRSGRVSAFGKDSERVARDPKEVGFLNPGLEAQFNGLSARYRDIMAGAATEATASQAMQDWVKPTAGFNAVLQEDFGPLAAADGSLKSTDAMADSAVNKLQGAIFGQFGSDIDLAPIYADYQSKGFSKKQAAIATYGEVGRRIAGASDMFLAGLSAAVGFKAGDAAGKAKNFSASKLSLARGAGAVGGGALFAYGVYDAQKQDRLSADAAAAQLGEELKADFMQVNPEGYAEFADRIDDAKDIQAVSAVLTEFYQDGKLTDKMIDSFKEEAVTMNTYSSWEGPLSVTIEPKPNPFD